MKILCLNLWGGRLFEDLTKFLHTQSQSVDVFCFQEVTSSPFHDEIDIEIAGRPRFSDVFEMVTALLPEFTGFYGKELEKIPGGTSMCWGSAVFVSKKHTVSRYEEIFTYGSLEDCSSAIRAYEFRSRVLQTVILNSEIVIHNIHGIWTPDKGDNATRLQQSQNINAVMEQFSLPQVLCGDLNLDPSTNSLELLTRDRHDWVVETGVKTTRTKHVKHDDDFADYIITTPDLTVNHFEVLKDVVSDHLPLILECTV